MKALALIVISAVASADPAPSSHPLVAILQWAFGDDVWTCGGSVDACKLELHHVRCTALHHSLRCDADGYTRVDGQKAGYLIGELAAATGVAEVAEIACESPAATTCAISIRAGDATIAADVGTGSHGVRCDREACVIDGNPISDALLAAAIAARRGIACEDASCTVAARVRCTTATADAGLTTVSRCDVR